MHITKLIRRKIKLIEREKKFRIEKTIIKKLFCIENYLKQK